MGILDGGRLSFYFEKVLASFVWSVSLTTALIFHLNLTQGHSLISLSLQSLDDL